MSNAMFQSMIDRKIGLSPVGNLVGNDLEITRPAVDVVITVGAESADVRAITVQVRDITGANIVYVEGVQVIMFTTAAMVAYATTGGSTGIAVGASGGLVALVAKKVFLAQTTVAGLLALTWTDIGTESVALGVRLPNGRTVVSAAFANA